MNSRSSNSTSN